MILRAIIMAGAALTLRGHPESVPLFEGTSAKCVATLPRDRAKAREAASSTPRGARDAVAPAIEDRDTKPQPPGLWITGLRGPRWWAPGIWTHLRYRLIVGSVLAKGRRILPLRAHERLAYLALRDSPLFDEAWYLEQNPDVAAAGVDPLHHLIKHGIYEGRAPSRELAPDGSHSRIGPLTAADARARYLRAIGELGRTPSGERSTDDKGRLHLLSDATVRLGLARFARFALFKHDDYLALNASLRAAPGLDTRRHAFTYGFSDGRGIFDRQTVANELGLRARAAPAPAPAAHLAMRETPRLSISILHNASGNVFLSDIARCLAHDLGGAGHDVVLLDDTDEPSRMGEHNIVVAPHEFFMLGRGPHWLSDDILRRSVMYNTEQPQTVWFDRAVPYNLVSRGVIDLSCQVASIYADCMPTLHCDPGGPALDGLPPDPRNPIMRVLPRAAQGPGVASSPIETRAIDVSFFGGLTAHRDRFFAKTARFFADYKTLLYCRRSTEPLCADKAVDLMAAARHVAFHSKLVLNIHRDEFGFFEWHRIVRLGIEAGAVVVSEPCLPHPDLKPNVHYFEESGRHIQNLVEWLLKTPDGRAEHRKVRDRALDVVARRRQARTAGKRIAGFIDSLEGASR